jgi:hypothetical protein
VAAVFFEPGEAGVSGTMEFRLPCAPALEDFAIGRDAFVLSAIDA